MTSRSHSYTAGPTTSNCDRYRFNIAPHFSTICYQWSAMELLFLHHSAPLFILVELLPKPPLCLSRNTETVFLTRKILQLKKTWVSPGLLENPARFCLLGRLLLLGAFLPDLPKTGRQTNMAWLDWVRSSSSQPMRTLKSWERSWWQNIPMKEGLVHFPASHLIMAFSLTIFSSRISSANAWCGSKWHV